MEKCWQRSGLGIGSEGGREKPKAKGLYKGTTRGSPPSPALPPGPHPPDVVQQWLALVMVLLEPGPELGGGDHEQRVAGSAQRCLQRGEQSAASTADVSAETVWSGRRGVCVCIIPGNKGAMQSRGLTRARSLCSRMFNKPWEEEETRSASCRPDFPPELGPWDPSLQSLVSISHPLLMPTTKLPPASGCRLLRAAAWPGETLWP